MDEVYAYALRLLRVRDYSVAKFREKLQARFGHVPEELIASLLRENFLNDRRFAENYAGRRRGRAAAALREELVSHGIAPEMVEEVLKMTAWPSLKDAMLAKMKVWSLRAPLESRDAARLFRALRRLGYDEDAIREEIEPLLEQ